MPVSRQLGIAAAAGLLSSILYLALLKGFALGVVLSYVAPLPLMMVGLAFGLRATVSAGFVALLAVSLGSGHFGALTYALTSFAPSLILASRALLWRDVNGQVEFYPPGQILAWLTAFGVMILFAGVLLLSGNPNGVEATVREQLSNVIQLMSVELPAATKEATVANWAAYFPSMVVGSWLIMVILNAVGAQRLLARYGKNARPTPDYQQLMLPDWVLVLMVVSLGVDAVLSGDVGYVAENLGLFLMIPFMCMGLASVHKWAATKPGTKLILAVMYGLLLLAFMIAAFLVAGLGLVRFWTMRFRRPKSGSGMEG